MGKCSLFCRGHNLYFQKVLNGIGECPTLSPVQSRRKRKVVKSSQKLQTISHARALKILAKQREREREEKLQKRAQKAINKFRPRKAERNKIVFIGTTGKRDAANKGRKGYMVYVDKRGKKKIIPDSKTGFKSNKLAEVNIPLKKNLKRVTRDFVETRRKLISTGKRIVKTSGSVKPKGAFDFSDKVVSKISASLKKAFDSQVSQRRFLMNALVTVKRPNGTTKTYSVQVPVAKPDHLAIKVGGMDNFIRQKFYAFLAKELAFDGFVTSGSANHVRRLAENEGQDRGEWTKDGEVWEGHDYDTVKIIEIEWKVEQLI